MKKLLNSFMVLLFTMTFGLSAYAAPGDLFVQLTLAGGLVHCSVMKVQPDGSFTEFVSASDIFALTGDDECEMSAAGLTVAGSGDVYFSEDESNSIIKATPDGVASIFLSSAQIQAVTEFIPDLSFGMVIGPDGDLYFNDLNSNSILKATIPGGVVSIVVSEAQVLAATGNTEVNLRGGIAFDCSGNLYITDDPMEIEEEQDSILVLTPGGALSIFVTEAQINAATDFNSTDLDSGMTFFGDSLYVLEDGECNCVLQITLDGQISVLVSEAQIVALTENGQADLTGGIALNQSGQVFFGDDGDNPEASNLITSTLNGSNVSLFVTNQELVDFYAPRAPQLEGSMAFEGVDVCVVLPTSTVPTLSEWGLIAMAGVLGIVGFMVIRRRTASAGV